MAAKAKKDLTLARLMPHEIVPIGGHDVIHPNGPDENRTANRLMASQMRTLLQEQVKRYQDTDQLMSPKDLKDIASAASEIAKFSAEVYNEQTHGSGLPKKVDEVGDEVGDEFDIGDAAKIIIPTPANESPASEGNPRPDS